MVIQAAIVRIMKARETLECSLLIQEVLDQLKSRFIPEISVINVKFISTKIFQINQFCFFRHVLIF
jgi:hypothetical protein